MRGYPIFVHQLSILLKAVPKRGKSVSKRASSSPERAKENKDVAPFFPLFSPPLSLSFPPFSLSKPYWYRGIIRERDLDPLDSKGCHDAPVYIGILNRFYSTTRNRLTRHNGRLENDFPPSPWKGPNHHHNRLTTFEQFDPREKLYTTITFSTGARGGTCAFGDNRRTSGSLQRTRID